MDSSDSEASVSKKTFKCTKPNCSASFSKNCKLVIHLRRHTGERPFVCNEEGCDKTYTNNSHLCRHKITTHGKTVQNSIVCSHDGCGAILANKYSLKKHFNRKHSSQQYPFNCTECPQGFDRKKQLQQHTYLHTGEATFSCDKCDSRFTTSYNLNKHKRGHRAYNCDCGLVFYRWSLLLAHKKSCRSRLKCDVCNKTFAIVRNFNAHKLTHKEKSEKLVFVCPFSECRRFYFYKKNLKFHINTFHKKNKVAPLKCTYPNCQVVLKTKELHRRHLQRHFQWKKKRQMRCDAGKPKKTIAAALIGENLTGESFKNVNEPTATASPQILEPHISTTEDVTDQDDPLLAKCDLVLKLLHEKIISVQ